MTQNQGFEVKGSLRPLVDGSDPYLPRLICNPSPQRVEFADYDADKRTFSLSVRDFEATGAWVKIGLSYDMLHALEKRWDQVSSTSAYPNVSATGRLYSATEKHGMLTDTDQNKDDIINNTKIIAYSNDSRSFCVDVMDTNVPAAWVQVTFAMDKLEEWAISNKTGVS